MKLFLNFVVMFVCVELIIYKSNEIGWKFMKTQTKQVWESLHRHQLGDMFSLGSIPRKKLKRCNKRNKSVCLSHVGSPYLGTTLHSAASNSAFQAAFMFLFEDPLYQPYVSTRCDPCRCACEETGVVVMPVLQSWICGISSWFSFRRANACVK